MREDLSWSCTHEAPEPSTYPAEVGSKLKFSSSWFGRFWVGPDYRTIGGPIVLCHIKMDPGTKVRLQIKSGETQLAIYRINDHEGLFELLYGNHRPTGKTITIREAMEQFHTDKLTVVSLPRK